MLSRLRSRLAAADPVLRVLGVSTLIGTLGRGVFLTVTVLYFHFIVGLSDPEISIVVAASSATGIVTSLIGGQLSDRFSARRVLLVALVIESVGLVSYSFVSEFWMAVTVACVAFGSETGAHSARSAIIARGFEGPGRVTARAVLRTITNVGIAVGSAVGGLALLIGTAEAYRAILIGAGVVYFGAAVLTLRLPASVDAATPAPAGPEGADAPIDGTSAAGAETDLGDAVDAARPSRWAHSPWRDPRYLALAALSGVFAMQFGLLEFGVPLWVAQRTDAPEAIVSVLLILNTVIVIAFQVPLSRGTHELRRAGRVIGLAGGLMAGACFVYAAAAGVSPVWAVVILLAAGTAHAFAEVFSQAGIWGLSFELADPVKAGAYQGIIGTFYSAGATFAPLIVTATALNIGLPGWGVLAVLFLLSAAGMTAIAIRAAQHQEAATRVVTAS
ncbi:MAG: MFS transporter [Pseudolysinimonas sp.]